MARPKKNFDYDKLDAILQFGATLFECEDILEVSESTLKRRIKSKYKCSFEHLRDKKMSKAKQNLRRKQYETAMAGNVTMQIWLGKNWLGQTDKVEQSIAEESQKIFTLNYSLPKDEK